MYCGQLLVTVKSNEKNPPTGELHKVLDYTPKSTVCLTSTKTKDYLLFGTIYDANMIEQKKSQKQLRFDISLGCNGTDDTDQSNKTEWYRPEKIDTGSDGDTSEARSNYNIMESIKSLRKSDDTSKYCRLNFEQDGKTKKPCMHLTARLPDHEFRIKNRVLITSIITELDKKIKVKRLKYENKNQNIQSKLQPSLLCSIKDVVEKDVKKLHDLLKSLKDEPNVNDLDHKLRIKRIKCIVSSL